MSKILFDDSLQNTQPLVVQGNVPAFLLKLWKIVEDRSSDHYISWSQDGQTFKVHDQITFSKDILPRFYKHSNFSSFVRQVNMYGFRKIVDPKSGSLKLEKDEWEFFHPHFQQGKPDQLQHIKRKVNAKDDMKVASSQIVHLLQDVEKLKGQAEFVNSRLELVKSENELLWRQVADLREQHQNQQNVINKLIQFFVQLVMGKTTLSRKRAGIDYPPLADSKKSKKDLELQPYQPSTSALSQLFQDTSYSVQSPTSNLSDDRITELSPVNLSVIEEGTVNLPSPEILTPKFIHEKSDGDTLEACCNNDKTNITESPFIFPDEYVPRDDSNLVISSNNGTLTTPIVARPETPLELDALDAIISKSTGLTTPVISTPNAVQRQTSFSDRSEINDDVEKISKSIEMLQDMLAKKQINIDIKNLDLLPLYNDLPTQVSIQDLIRLSQRSDSDGNDDEKSLPNDVSSKSKDINLNLSPSASQLVPYTQPFSPRFIDPEFDDDDPGMNQSDFFDSVLEQE